MTDHLPPESIQLIEGLKSPACYPHAVKRVELIETHISWVLLTGGVAYKIKKPVDFGFLDFSTLKRRKFFCEEELRLNRRLAESIYLSVVPITGSPEDPKIEGEGEGEPIEYAVKMREFAQEALLSHAIENGRLQAEHIEILADEIAEFHGRIAVADPAESDWGTAERCLGPAWANFRALLNQDIDSAGSLFGESRLPCELESSRPQLLDLLEWTRSQGQRLSKTFESRRQAGAVRECHGDMHLNNMLLEEGAVVIFDGIDFNPDLRWIDVQSEVAFCVMDLIDRQRPDFAYRLLNSYLERTGDYAGLVVQPFYLAHRALVRAKVAHLGFEQHEEREVEARKDLARQRQEYLDLATKLTKPRSPCLMITHGVSGSGKSFGTQCLVESLGAVRVRSDVERKRLAGMDRLEDSAERGQNDLYSPSFSNRTYARLAECAEQIVTAGFTAIVDATFLKAEQRALMRTLAGKLNVPFLILDFHADEAQLRARIAKRLAEGADPSEANLDVLENQLKNREPLTPAEGAFAIRVDTATPEYQQQLLRAVETNCKN